MTPKGLAIQRMNNTKALLLKDLTAKRVVPVLGAGVSIATAGMPSWRGLVESGVAHALDTRSCSELEATAISALLSQGKLVEAAQSVKAVLGASGGEYGLWL